MSWVLYGANGYTGELCAREAVRRGERPILAGRNPAAVSELANELGLEHRVFGLDDPAGLDRGLQGATAVLHCAGPFVLTSAPMIEACLRNGVHYLDITGEIAVFEGAFRLDQQAREAGVTLLPGVGFDVVPTDCLAASLGQNVEGATHLELAFYSHGGSISRGTMKTMIEGLPYAGAVRAQGKIRPVPAAFDAKKIPFSCGERWAMTIAWGDVSTAFRSTHIPNIRVYTGTPPRSIRRMKRMRPLLPIAGLKPIKRLLQWWVGRTVTGPNQEARDRGRVYLWGEARREDGSGVIGHLDTPEGYAFTALASIEATKRVVHGGVPSGAITPSLAFGAGFVRELEGVGDLAIAPIDAPA